MRNLILVLIFMVLSISSYSQSYKKQNLPQYLIENGDTIGIVLTIEQVQKLDHNSELLELFERLSIDCDKLDTYYVGVINSMNQKIAILDLKIKKQDEGIRKQDDMVRDLQYQLSNTLLRLSITEKQRSNDSTIIGGLKEDLKKSKTKGTVGWVTTGVVSAIAIFLGILLSSK